MVQLHCVEEQADFHGGCTVTPVHQVTVTRCCATVGRESTVGSPREQFDSNGQYFKVDTNTNSQVGALKWGALGLYRESPALPGALQSH